MTVSMIDANVRLDDTLLASVDQVANRFGVTREYMLEDSIRRGLAGRLLDSAAQQLTNAQDAADDKLNELITAEIATARQARRNRR